MRTDILIVGSGCAGLYCALNLPSDKNIVIITKSEALKCDSYLAQGGICVLRDENDFDAFYDDTMRAGHHENDPTSVEIMINNSRDAINDLISYGVDFQKDESGELLYTKEGAHSNKRILFHADITGKEITTRLFERVLERKNIKILENTTLVDLLCHGNECYGAVIRCSDGAFECVECDYTVLATGGIGGLYPHSTNYSHLTADALAIAVRHGVELRDVSYVQIHPTTLYVPNQQGKSFLISESVRGEGAKLYNKNMERFVDELLPRDLLTQAILKQMELDGTEHVWEDMRTIPEDEVRAHFPNIVEACRSAGYDVFKECIPVVPAQHYFMGGIRVDYQSKSSMKRLYAIGETACNGVHGKNRLASNSLLESLVFAKRAALDISADKSTVNTMEFDVDFELYSDPVALEALYKDIVLKEIEKDKLSKEK